ncbi:MAG TPA: hydrogenase maturation protease, partial [bacterium]|nr:hydrogenase maturation protease [bacterium]HEX68505.1 hydrogenase maturation protease [bacterium]
MFKVTVIGLGNPLLRDEGLGVKVVEKLKEIPLPDGVKILEAGTYWLEDEESLKAEKIILVDAVKG